MRNRTLGGPILLVITSLAAALSGCGGQTTREPRSEDRPATLKLSAQQRGRISVEAVEPTGFERSVETTGTVAFDSNRATQVLAPISGPVERLLVSLGDRVTAGQPLATVASPDFAADVGTFLKAQAVARNARRIADLDEQLLANDAIARREVEQAQTDAVSAEADRDAALQQLRAIGADEQTIAAIRRGSPVPARAAAIRAPISGTVVERLVTPGQLIQAGSTPCFTIAELSTVWVLANIFESDLPLVAVGDPAVIEVDAGVAPLNGTVEYVSAVVDPQTRAVEARIVTSNPGEVLKRDMYVRVSIHSKRRSTGLLVPASAVLRDDENLPFVFLQSADGSFSRRRISIGYRTGEKLEVASGLAAGDRVVAEGGLFMQFAQSQ